MGKLELVNPDEVLEHNYYRQQYKEKKIEPIRIEEHTAQINRKTVTDIMTVSEYLIGIQYAFVPFYVWYSFIKTIVFAFVIASMSSYYGYYAYGGALEVGRASTKAVVNSSIVILLLDVVLTNLMLN